MIKGRKKTLTKQLTVYRKIFLKLQEYSVFTQQDGRKKEVSKTLVCDRKITVPFEVSPELPGFSVQMVSAQGLGEIMNI